VARPFEFDRAWVFATPPGEFYATVCRTDQFTDWWSWLRRFEIDGMYPGAQARCLIQAPLPYALNLTITIETVEPESRIETRVEGDLQGPARLEIEPHPLGCSARLVWSLELRDPILRNIAIVARPAMVWAHDRVVAAGITEFERRARFSRPS